METVGECCTGSHALPEHKENTIQLQDMDLKRQKVTDTGGSRLDIQKRGETDWAPSEGLICFVLNGQDQDLCFAIGPCSCLTHVLELSPQEE